MSFYKKLLSQVKKLIPIVAPVYIILTALLFSIAIISTVYSIDVEKFTRDPVVILGGQPFIGIISNIGVLFWCATSAICFFSFAICRNYSNETFSRFLIASGILTLLLLLDDLFLFHEYIFPEYLHIPEKLVYLIYLMLVSLYFLKFKGVILRTEYVLIIIACGFFALSIVIDNVLPQQGWGFLIEDGLKLFGIVTWFTYFIRTCFIQIQTVVNR